MTDSSIKLTAQEILKKTFGYDSFRPGQGKK